MSKVAVMIYGNEYTITGDRQAEEIRDIASKVDEKMKLASRSVYDSSSGSIGVLAALMIGEEAADQEREIKRLKNMVEKMEEELKSAAQKSLEAKEKARESEEEMNRSISENQEEMQKLKDKCKDYENTFFDLQMENIKLKSEIEKLKGSQ